MKKKLLLALMVAMVSSVSFYGCGEVEEETKSKTEKEANDEDNDDEDNDDKDNDDEDNDDEDNDDKDNDDEDNDDEDNDDEDNDDEDNDDEDNDDEDNDDKDNDDDKDSISKKDDTDGSIKSSAKLTELSDDIYDYQISIDDNVLQLPVKYSELEEYGFKYKENEDDTLAANTTAIGYSLVKDGIRYSVNVTNFDINAIPVTDCYITQISVDSLFIDDSSDVNVQIAGGIDYNKSTKDDIKNAFGTPSSSYDSDDSDFSSMKYEGDSAFQSVSFSFKNDKIYEISVENAVKPEDFETGEVDLTRPEILDKYEAPSVSSDKFDDFIVSIDKEYYQLPAPVSEFVNNGWSIADSDADSVVSGESFTTVTLRKGGIKFDVKIDNYTSNATSVENCFVTKISLDTYNSKDVDVELFNGIKMGMSQKNLEAALKGTDYEKDDSFSSTTSYKIEVPGTYQSYVSIYTDKDDSKVSRIEINNKVDIKDLYKKYGLKF